MLECYILLFLCAMGLSCSLNVIFITILIGVVIHIIYIN